MPMRYDPIIDDDIVEIYLLDDPDDPYVGEVYCEGCGETFHKLTRREIRYSDLKQEISNHFNTVEHH